MHRLFAAVERFARCDEGQDLLEYGLLAVLIAIVVMAAVTSLGVTVQSVFWQPIAQAF